jgi:hypothetical protein
VPDKVSAISLVNCRNVSVRFISVIAKVEVIRSEGCIIICAGTCATYQLDGCTDTRVVFAAKDVSPVTWITASSTGTRLIGRVEDVAAAAGGADEKEVKDELAAHAGDINSEIVAPSPASDAPPTNESVIPQYTTTFASGAFGATTLLIREGQAGYVSPVAASS